MTIKVCEFNITNSHQGTVILTDQTKVVKKCSKREKCSIELSVECAFLIQAQK